MKKLVSLLAVIALLLTAVCAVAEEAPAAVAVASLVSYAQTDSEGNTEECFDYALTLYDDNTFVLNYGDGEGTGTWEETDDGFVLTDANGIQAPAIYDDEIGAFVLDASGTTVYFDIAQDFTLPERIEAADEAAFEGTWKVYALYLDGTYAELANESEESLIAWFGTAEPTIVIENGVLTAVGHEIGTCAFEDGGLTVTGNDETIYFVDLCEGNVLHFADTLFDYFAEK